MGRHRQYERGRIIVDPDINVWPHEMDTARALASAGMTVEFVRRSEAPHATSADVLIDGVLWEMKAPVSDKLRRIQKTLREALHQSPYVVFDARRMKRLPDAAIEREVRKQAAELRSLRGLRYVSKRGEVIDIR